MNRQRRRWLRQLAALPGLPALGALGALPALPALGAAPTPTPARAQAQAQTQTQTQAQAKPQAPDAVQEGRPLAFPADHGAHLAARTEWWYATGWLGRDSAPTHGFQITFFRSSTGLAADNPSRFAARHVLFAHAAALDVAAGTHAHDQRLVRWNGSAGAATGEAATDRGAVQLGGWTSGWQMNDEAGGWRVQAGGSALRLDLRLQRTQPLLLQGNAGFSRKGPAPAQASHYYSEVQLQATGRVTLGGSAANVAASNNSSTTNATGRAWMDHEWSDAYLAPGAVGWDWVGMNLFDGSALMAFVIRRADGSALWAGGSFRAPGTAARAFSADSVRFTPGTRWRSPATGAQYPVLWQLDSPAGRYTVRALVEAQELDSRSSTGTVYWEGLSELLDAQGRRVGLGYLEMTGYVAPLKV